MGIAAIPNYIRQTNGDKPFDDAPPGHRFNLYFEGWIEDWTLDKNKKTEALKKVFDKTPKECTQLADNLRERQRQLASHLGESCLPLLAKSTSPFATGLGLEHPVENGFSFLNPYGLPYLPGSGVKGVLRRAAEELALFDYSLPTENGQEDDAPSWTLLDVWWLFGFDATAAYLSPCDKNASDSEKEANAARHGAYREHLEALCQRDDWLAFMQAALPKKEQYKYLKQDNLFEQLPKIRFDLQLRGSLSFWDVIPYSKADKLAIDIMTPHHTEYYKGNSTPHDSEQPTPIPFLVVQPGSEFVFHVVFEPSNILPGLLQQHWRGLLKNAFKHAFDWLGFGAKTAVGYGAMALNKDDQGEDAQKTAATATTTIFWQDCKLGWAKGSHTLTATDSKGVRATRQGTEGRKLFDALSSDLKTKLEKSKSPRENVEVEQVGNAFSLIGVASSKLLQGT